MTTRIGPATRALLEGSDLQITLPQLAEGGWAAAFRDDIPDTGSDAVSRDAVPPAVVPLVLEIGIGKDSHIVERAAREPGRRFVGIEYSKKKLDKVHAKAIRRGVRNLRLLHANIFAVLDPVFADQSIEMAFMFFPDPWPKKRHAKNRMVQPQLMRVLARKLELGAPFELRTDHPLYREQMVEVLEDVPGLANELEDDDGAVERGYRTRPLSDRLHVPTLFETKFAQRGLTLHYLYYRRDETPLDVQPPTPLDEIGRLDPMRSPDDEARDRREEAKDD